MFLNPAIKQAGNIEIGVMIADNGKESIYKNNDKTIFYFLY